MDHVSDSFLETNVPLLVLIEAAKNGNEKEVKDYAQVFREHANKLIEVGTVSFAEARSVLSMRLMWVSSSRPVEQLNFPNTCSYPNYGAGFKKKKKHSGLLGSVSRAVTERIVSFKHRREMSPDYKTCPNWSLL